MNLNLKLKGRAYGGFCFQSEIKRGAKICVMQMLVEEMEKMIEGKVIPPADV
jgi:hypothetical protein